MTCELTVSCKSRGQQARQCGEDQVEVLAGHPVCKRRELQHRLSMQTKSRYQQYSVKGGRQLDVLRSESGAPY
jgi:hypothetical protein